MRSKKRKAKIEKAKKEITNAKSTISTKPIYGNTINQLRNCVEYRKKSFYKALYLTELKLPSITHYPEDKKLYFIVENDSTALYHLEQFRSFYI
jgi:hypothetical protein